jgi:hypothetical protein
MIDRSGGGVNASSDDRIGDMDVVAFSSSASSSITVAGFSKLM